MKRITKLAPKISYIVILFTIMGAMGFTGLYLAVGPDLPEVETIRQIRIQTPMSVYAKDGQLINVFGDVRRVPITLDQVPQDFINALLSTEDVRFYEHSGVDLKGVLRAIFKLATTGTKSQGASTITMLVARNYYLTREKRFSRKFTEMFVAWKLESELTKDEILEIFLNKIEFGHRSTGLGAASQVYYGTTLDKLNLAQLATLAGIPKGQSSFNPVSNPKKAKSRRKHVLGRMLDQGHIDQAQFDEADQYPIETQRHGEKTTVSAPYLAEMAHLYLIEQYGLDSAHSDGLKVYTSIDPKLQSYAQEALRTSALEYDRRHGYRPVEQHYEIDESVTEEDMLDRIGDFSQIGNLIPALVISTDVKSAEILLADGSHGKIYLKDSLWAREYVDENNRKRDKLVDINQIIVIGDVIRVFATDEFEIVEKNEDEKTKSDETQVTEAESKPDLDEEHTEQAVGLPIFLLSQIPDVNAGFVVLNPKNGAIEALVGGFNFSKSQFNMVTQARRQLGSNIKPFIYSAALDKGLTAANIINDSPIIDWDASTGVFWRPENAGVKYRGPVRLRYALTWSINTVSVRLIKKIGAHYAEKYLAKIGFPDEHMQPVESLALGSASFTPLEVATGYATLANGGFQVTPWYIQRIEDSQGRILFEEDPIQVCEQCLETTEAQGDDIPGENTETPELSLLNIDAEKPIQNLPLQTVAEDKVAPRVIEARNRFIIDNIMKDVIHKGTAWKTLRNANSSLLKRSDLAGKTGTTNDVKDAWFSGYNNQYVASAWVGFRDHSKKLGKVEYGAKAALPIWQRFMEKALKGTRQYSIPRPNGIVDVKIDLKNGKLASIHTQKSDFEVFREENVPTEYSEAAIETINFDHFDDEAESDQEGDLEKTNKEDTSDEIDFD